VSAERLLISAILRSGSISKVRMLGLRPQDMVLYKEEFSFLLDNDVPSKAVFHERFPDFKIRKVKPSDIDNLVDRVRDNKIQSDLGNIMKNTANQIGEKRPIELVIALARSLDEIQGRFSSGKDIDILSSTDLMVDEYKRRQKSSKNGNTVGIPFGIPTLDKEMGGMSPGEVITVVGRQGEGKTWFSLDAAASAVIHNKKVLYISLEMPPELIGFRLHTLLYGITHENKKNRFPNLNLIMGKDIDPKKYKTYLEKVRKEYKGSFVVPQLSRNFFFSTATVASKIEEHRPDLVVIDYIGLMQGDNKKIENWQEISQQIRDLKNFALRYKIAMMVNAQANRQAADPKNDDAPKLHQISGSDAIGANSDRVISLRLMSKVNKLLVSVEKNRYGRAKFSFKCKWDVDQGFIKELPSEEQFFEE
jgi:replicative DNA helicase